MTRRWGKLDCKIHENDKFRNLPATAAGIWLLTVAWSADNETDGFVPRDVVAGFCRRNADGRTTRHAGYLVKAGLWDEVDGGYMIHDFADYQLTKVQKAEVRASDATRQARSRATRLPPRNHLATTSLPPRNQHAATTEPLFPDESVVSHRDILPKSKRESEIRETASLALEARNAGTLVGEWIDSLDARPTPERIGQVSRKIRVYLEQYPYDVVREAIFAWSGTGKQPSQIDFHMNQILNPPTKPTWGPARQESTRNARVGAGLELAEKYDTLENAMRGQVNDYQGERRPIARADGSLR